MFAAYYNTIFPLAGGKEAFFESILKRYNPTTALDLGCATGELTSFLNGRGCKTLGVDLSQDLLDLAKEQQAGKFVLADMVDYLQGQPEKYDLLICIGNTLPHLEPPKLKKFMQAVPKWLSKNGILIIQTVNYSKILKNKETGLPTIERPDAGVRFTRLYSYSSQGSITFTAVLERPGGRDRSAVTLWPYTAEEIKHMLPGSFIVEAEYGGFTKTIYDPEQSSAWVLVARTHN